MQVAGPRSALTFLIKQRHPLTCVWTHAPDCKTLHGSKIMNAGCRPQVCPYLPDKTAASLDMCLDPCPRLQDSAWQQIHECRLQASFRNFPGRPDKTEASPGIYVIPCPTLQVSARQQNRECRCRLQVCPCPPGRTAVSPAPVPHTASLCAATNL